MGTTASPEIRSKRSVTRAFMIKPEDKNASGVRGEAFGVRTTSPTALKPADGGAAGGTTRPAAVSDEFRVPSSAFGVEPHCVITEPTRAAQPDSSGRTRAYWPIEGIDTVIEVPSELTVPGFCTSHVCVAVSYNETVIVEDGVSVTIDDIGIFRLAGCVNVTPAPDPAVRISTAASVDQPFGKSPARPWLLMGVSRMSSCDVSALAGTASSTFRVPSSEFAVPDPVFTTPPVASIRFC